MIKIKKINNLYSLKCFSILKANTEDLNYFSYLGWSLLQFKAQLAKKNNFGLGLFEAGILQGFVLGDLITIEKNLEYEILLIYVIKQKRNLGYATKLLKKIPLILDKFKLKKIILEVSTNNLSALKLYRQNGFKKIGTRKKYYNINKTNFDAYFFEKLINAKY